MCTGTGADFVACNDPNCPTVIAQHAAAAALAEAQAVAAAQEAAADVLADDENEEEEESGGGDVSEGGQSDGTKVSQNK